MRAVVCCHGSYDDSVFDLVRTAELVIAADGGAHLALAAGRLPDAVVGDLDSLRPAELTQLENHGVRVMRFPVDKDETDSELALGEAIEAGASEVVLVGALGGSRIEHSLGNLGLLARAAASGVHAWICDGDVEAHYLGPEAPVLELADRQGDRLSLVPFASRRARVSATGVRWPLSDESLAATATRGISNVVVDACARVELHEGALIVVLERLRD